jgi:hypothetical protein
LLRLSSTALNLDGHGGAWMHKIKKLCSLANAYVHTVSAKLILRYLRPFNTHFRQRNVLSHISFYKTNTTMCKYIDEVITYTGCQQHHRVTTRRFFDLCLARGLSMHCSSPEPSSVAVMGSTRKRGVCPVCSGARLEVEEVISIQTAQ